MRMSEVTNLPIRNILVDQEPPVIVIDSVFETGWRPKMGKPRQNEIHNQVLATFLKNDLKNSNRKRKWFLDDGNGGRAYSRYGHLTEVFGDIGTVSTFQNTPLSDP